MDRSKLQSAFDKLEQLREHQEQPHRSTSAAKEYGPDGLRGTSLENAPAMGQQFAANKNEMIREPIEGRGSQQVRDSTPEPAPRPPPEIAREPDREKHEAEMTRDDKAARLDEFRSIAESSKQRDQDQDRQRDQGLEM